MNLPLGTLGNFSCFFCYPKSTFSKKFFQEYHLSIGYEQMTLVGSELKWDFIAIKMKSVQEENKLLTQAFRKECVKKNSTKTYVVGIPKNGLRWFF